MAIDFDTAGILRPSAMLTSLQKTRRVVGAFWAQIGKLGAAYFSSEAIGKGGMYLVILWLATTMPVEDFGTLSLLLSLLSLFSVIAGLGLSDAVVRGHILNDASDAAKALAISIPPLLTLAVLLPTSLAAPAVGSFLSTPSSVPLLAIGGGGVLSLRQAWLASLRAERASAAYIVSRTAEPLVFAGGIIMIVVSGHLTVVNAAIAYVIALAVVALYGTVRLAGSLRAKWSWSDIRSVLTFSIPLVPHSFAMTGIALFDQVVIQQHLGPGDTGRYAFAYRLGMLMSLVVFGFSAAWGPWVLQRLSSGDPGSLRPTARVALRIGLVAATLLSWGLPIVAGWVAPPEYDSSLSLIPLIVYGYVWFGLYTILAGHFVFQGRSRALAAASVSALVFNVVTNYLFVPSFGITAAAVTTIVSYALLTALALGLGIQGSRELGFRACLTETALATPVILAPLLFLQ